MGDPVTYARVFDGTVTASDPPDLLDPDDPTAEGRWWDLRQHDADTPTWESETLAPQDRKSVV